MVFPRYPYLRLVRVRIAKLPAHNFKVNMKICTQCKENKSIENYKKIGLYRHSMCDPCRLEYYKKHNEKIKKNRNYKLW